MWALFYQRKSYASCFNHTKGKIILFIKINEHFFEKHVLLFSIPFSFLLEDLVDFRKLRRKLFCPKKDPLLFCMYNEGRKYPG